MIMLHFVAFITSQIAKFMEPTWGPPGSCWPQMGPMLAPWTLLLGLTLLHQSQTSPTVVRHMFVTWVLIHLEIWSVWTGKWSASANMSLAGPYCSNFGDVELKSHYLNWLRCRAVIHVLTHSGSVTSHELDTSLTPKSHTYLSNINMLNRTRLYTGSDHPSCYM